MNVPTTIPREELAEVQRKAEEDFLARNGVSLDTAKTILKVVRSTRGRSDVRVGDTRQRNAWKSGYETAAATVRDTALSSLLDIVDGAHVTDETILEYDPVFQPNLTRLARKDRLFYLLARVTRI